MKKIMAVIAAAALLISCSVGAAAWTPPGDIFVTDEMAERDKEAIEGYREKCEEIIDRAEQNMPPEYLYRVVDKDGNPVPNITFERAIDNGFEADQEFSTSQLYCVGGTNGDGEVLLRETPSDVAQWWVNKETGGDIGEAVSFAFPKREVSNKEPVVLIWTAETPRQTAIKFENKLIITVTDSKGRPLPGAKLTYSRSSDTFIAYGTRTAYTGADGIYILPNPHIGEYRVLVEYPPSDSSEIIIYQNSKEYIIAVEKEETAAHTLELPFDLYEPTHP